MPLRLCAVLLVALIALPFTEPFATLHLQDVCRTPALEGSINAIDHPSPQDDAALARRVTQVHRSMADANRPGRVDAAVTSFVIAESAHSSPTQLSSHLASVLRI